MDSEKKKTVTKTPKALVHEKYGQKASYKIEEVVMQQLQQSATCPGLKLPIPQRPQILYRCHLHLPDDLVITSDTFSKKKDAEQSAAKMAVDKLGIQSSTPKALTPQEAWEELVHRISVLFSDDFLSCPHPLVGHFRLLLQGDGGMLPVSAIVSSDVKVNSLCKVFDPKSESDPLLLSSYVRKAAKLSTSVSTTDDGSWIRKVASYLPDTLSKLMTDQDDSCTANSLTIQSIHIPFDDNVQVDGVCLDVSANQYYMDEIAQKLRCKDAAQILVSRTIGKASSEMKLYFSASEILPAASDSPVDAILNAEKNGSLEPLLNKRASYLSGQRIYGNAILANVGYTWKSPDLFYEDVLLSVYYRMLLSKIPDGHYKLSTGAVLAAELPTTFNSRSNWKGPLPRDLLIVFCRQHRLSEPVFLVKRCGPSESAPEIPEACKNAKIPRLAGDVDKTTTVDQQKQTTFGCDVKLLSKMQVPLLDYLSDGSATYRKDSDALQNAALRVLTWLNLYFKQLDMPIEKLTSFGHAYNITIYPSNFAQEFETLPSREHNYVTHTESGSNCVDQLQVEEKNTTLFNIEGPDSGVFPSHGSMACISYYVTLVRKEEPLRVLIEKNDEFEFEVGAGAVIGQFEVCVMQLSVNQSAQFTIELPKRELIFAAAIENMNHPSQLSLENCFLEYSIKVLGVTEPMEERMEQAFFSPPLSKQRVEFAVKHINASKFTTLVDFGCGSGSLLDPILEHPTTLEKIVGVDISLKSLARAAKLIHTKLSTNSKTKSSIKAAVLYDGSITEFDSRLYGVGIATCLEVIEHMQEEQASLFGNVVLSSFCPEVLIVSTPNYEYNPILQRSSLPNKEDEAEDKLAPCRFRNHDHKFEWTRQQFQHWATDIAGRHNYSVEFSGVGGSGDVEPGYASQIAIFRRGSHQVEKTLAKEESSYHPYEVIWEWSKDH